MKEMQFNKDNYLTLKERKRHFLEMIISKNPNSMNKYKRVVSSPIRYSGGKSLAVGHVLELLPDNINKIVSPFFGGGSVEIVLSKYMGLEVIGYDILELLTNYWHFQINQPVLLYNNLNQLKPDKKTYDWIREILFSYWEKVRDQSITYNRAKKIILDKKEYKLLDNNDLLRATFFYFNFNLSYAPAFLGWSSKIYLDQAVYDRLIKRVKEFQPFNLKVKCLDFHESIKKHNHDFLYCDPPYYIGGDSKVFKGIYPQRNFPIHHEGFDHEGLSDLLHNHKNGFILSYNDCSQIRELYSDFQIIEPSWQYTMGQGETRIGKIRTQKRNDNIKKSHELLIIKEK